MHEKIILILERYGELLGDKELLKEDIDEITEEAIDRAEIELAEFGWAIKEYNDYEYSIEPIEEE